MSQNDTTVNSNYSRIQVGSETRSEIITRLTTEKETEFKHFLFWNIPLVILDMLMIMIFPKQCFAWYNVITVCLFTFILSLSIYYCYHKASNHIGKIILMHIALILITIPDLVMLLLKRILGSYWTLVNIAGSNGQVFGYYYFGVLFYLSINLSLPLTTVIMGRKLRNFVKKYKKSPLEEKKGSCTDDSKESAIELS